MDTAFITNDLPDTQRSANLLINVELGGGVELLFGKRKAFTLQLPVAAKQNWTIKDLIFYLRDELLQEREDLFVQDGSVRPGILVLVNDADWELMDTLNYQLQNNDTITFISTLHGG